MMKGLSHILASILTVTAFTATTPASAQFQPYAPITAPAQPTGAIALPVAGKSSAATAPEQWLTQDGIPFVQNVSQPTLVPILPPPGKRNGTAVIIAPGGAFMVLAMQNEGWDAARWLAAHGVSAFVLKYRVLPTPEGAAAGGYIADVFRGAPASPRFLGLMGAGIDLAVSDSQSAMRLVRSRAREWGIDPKRIGFMGFSAGAVAGLNLVSRDADGSRPDFIISVYGTMTKLPLPKGVPPLFTAIAADDQLFGHSDFGLLNAWNKAGGSVEAHVFDQGGHGFGFAGRPGTTTVYWKDSLLWWLSEHGLAR
ncbi:alpha/beta hydrolase [Sphingomonas aquatilis]